MRDDQDGADWALALDGDGQAFGRVFERHRHRVLRHCLRLVPTEVDAADTVAIVFLETWRLRARVRLVDDSMLPWLLVTATNTARNQSRAARRYRTALDRLPPPEPVPDHADRDDDGAAVRALRTLPAKDQEVLVLAVLEGLGEREVAAALGLPPGTVKSRLSRARRRLADRLAQHHTDEHAAAPKRAVAAPTTPTRPTRTDGARS